MERMFEDAATIRVLLRRLEVGLLKVGWGMVDVDVWEVETRAAVSEESKRRREATF